MHIVREVGLDLQGTIVSLDGVYDCRANGFVSVRATVPVRLRLVWIGPRRGGR
jgi:hypothetical protein